MASSFLIAKRAADQLWACVDPDSLCTSPAIGERRFAAYLAPFTDQHEARQALIEAGADPATITDEIRPRRCRGTR